MLKEKKVGHNWNDEKDKENKRKLFLREILPMSI